MWPWKKTREERPELITNGHLKDAEDAVQRARKAAEEAEEHLREARDLARRAMVERSENHFAPDIERAMRRRRRS